MLESLSLDPQMIEVEVEYGTAPELTAEMVRAQLESLVNDDVFRSSKRSVAFLRYVVEEDAGRRVGPDQRAIDRRRGLRARSLLRHQCRPYRAHRGNRAAQAPRYLLCR